MLVFLSSTYNDLIEHRKAAHDALEQLGLHVIWMEAFGARPVESTQACSDEVSKCELFVGIYAHRYGYIPAGLSVSITEQEFDHAKNLGKSIFGFIVSEDHPWSPKLIEHDKKTNLDAFLSKVKQQPVKFFTTPENLASGIASSVGNYLSEHKPSTNHQPLTTPRGNTLPSQPYFFGRVEELKTIASALSPESRTWGALIDGPGGIGKTALAIRAAHQAEGFERKIFITAKVRELTPEGEKPLRDFSRDNYVRMLDELGKELGEDGIEKLAPDERPNTLRLALAGKRALIVFDNLETLPEDERTRLFQFLSRLPEGNKAIVTSRRRTDVDARIVRLDRLARDEAMQLIAELAAKYPRLARASQQERDDLYAITQGNPLFIRWIAGQLGRAGSQCRTIAEACKFIEDAPKGNDPLEYIFGDLLETFSQDETQVLAALTYFTQPAKLKWLAQMTDLPERSAETALEDLADRSILISNLESRTFYLPPLAAQFIKTRRPEAVTQTGDALVNRAYAIAMQYGGNNNYSGFETLEQEWGFISTAFPSLKKDNIQTFLKTLDGFAVSSGKWDEYISWNEQAELLAVTQKEYLDAGKRAYRIGWIYRQRQDAQATFECANRMLNYISSIHSSSLHEEAEILDLKSAALQLLGKSYQLRRNFSEAIKVFGERININRQLGDTSELAVSLNDLAYAELLDGNTDLGLEHCHEALRIAEEMADITVVTYQNGNLSDFYIAKKEFGVAEFYAKKGLELTDKLGMKDYSGFNCMRMAKSLIGLGRFQDAKPYIQRATIIFNELRHPELKTAQEALGEIEEKMKDEG